MQNTPTTSMTTTTTSSNYSTFNHYYGVCSSVFVPGTCFVSAAKVSAH